MKNTKLLMIIACAFVFCFAGNAFSQTVPTVGGYNAVSISSADVVAAAEFAAKRQSAKRGTTVKVSAINRAESQIVAGTNYRLCLSANVFAGKRKASTKQFSAVVFKNLRGAFTLKSWKEERCGSGD
jgi:hypothetical protein